MGVFKLSQLNINTENLAIQKIDFLSKNGVELYLKREDLIHPIVSGNKFRKLKYNLEEFKSKQHDVLVTFGGAHSNHITATAFACKEKQISCLGIIRGKEWENKIQDSFTLNFAQSCGMKLLPISRKTYLEKEQSTEVKKALSQYQSPFILPEGGTNVLAIKGCEEILDQRTKDFDWISCCVGTAGTISGIIKASERNQKILGFSVLRQSDWMNDEIQNFTTKHNYTLNNEFHFGGYAKINSDLINFVNKFKQKTKIQIEPIYTGKMLYGLNELIEQDYFKKKTKILAIHTGGLQGISGMNQRIKRKGLQIL